MQLCAGIEYGIEGSLCMLSGRTVEMQTDGGMSTASLSSSSSVQEGNKDKIKDITNNENASKNNYDAKIAVAEASAAKQEENSRASNLKLQDRGMVPPFFAAKMASTSCVAMQCTGQCKQFMWVVEPFCLQLQLLQWEKKAPIQKSSTTRQKKSQKLQVELFVVMPLQHLRVLSLQSLITTTAQMRNLGQCYMSYGEWHWLFN